jgi:hypothetical protein
MKIRKKPKEVHYNNAVCSSTTILSPVCDEMSASRSAICLSLFFFFSCKSQDTKFLFCLPILIPQGTPGRICLDQIQINVAFALMLLLRILLSKPNNRCCCCYCCSTRSRVVVDRCLQFQIKRGSGTLERRDPNKTNKNLG